MCFRKVRERPVLGQKDVKNEVQPQRLAKDVIFEGGCCLQRKELGALQNSVNPAEVISDEHGSGDATADLKI